MSTDNSDFGELIEETKVALGLFFDNKFDEAAKLLKQKCKTSLYHALGFSVIKFFNTILTFEEEHIVSASEILQNCIYVCEEIRKKSTITEKLGKIVKRTNYDSFTPEEIHAELCHAEALLFKAALTIIEDESLMSFIRAGVKIRACLNSYRECSQIMSNRNWTSDCHKEHFEGGVRMGVGTFNLMVSLLPQRVTRLLDFIGFAGSRAVGLDQLKKGYELENSIRQILSTMTLLGYHLVLIQVKSNLEGDLELCEKILQSQLEKYPSSAWFLFFKGRFELVKGNISKAIEWYIQSWESQNKWPQFHHLCFWELTWAACLQQDWRMAASYAERLCNESTWSKTVYMYQKASMLLMLGKDRTPEETFEIEQLLEDAPKHIRKVAGKTFPIEKFVQKRSKRFFMQKKKLALPAVEMLFIWNMFRVLKHDMKLADSILRQIEKAQQEPIETWEHSKDNQALLLMLKGACLRQMDKPLLAEEALLEAIALESALRDDAYIVPYSKMELAQIMIDGGDKVRALLLLEEIKKKFTGYSMEARLLFKVDLAIAELTLANNKD